MLSFDLRSLESHAARVDGELDAGDAVWEPHDPKPVAPIRVSGRLSHAGAGRFYFSGHMEGTAATTCRRCLEPVSVAVSEELHLLLVGEEAEEADEPDVYLIDLRERELDLRPCIREEWLLSVPAFTVCRESCLGLCATCGADRNRGECSCTPPQDSRWDTLRAESR
jgi:uncharacterized protein